MPATPTTVTRTDDPSGDDFATYDKDAGAKVQAVALDAEVQGEILSWDVSSASAETNRVSKASEGRVFSAAAVLDPSVLSDRYLMVFNKATAPANNDVPILRALLPAGGQASIDLGVYGLAVPDGIAVAVSTTANLLTLPGSGEAYFQVSYV